MLKKLFKKAIPSKTTSLDSIKTVGRNNTLYGCVSGSRAFKLASTPKPSTITEEKSQRFMSARAIEAPTIEISTPKATGQTTSTFSISVNGIEEHYTVEQSAEVANEVLSKTGLPQRTR